MNKYNRDEQNLIDLFDKENSLPSKKFEKELDKLMQERLLTKKTSFFSTFSFYLASLAVVVFTGVLSASFLHVFTNSSQQSQTDTKILSESEKDIAVENINKNNINFLKQPKKIEENIQTFENTKINKSSVTYDYSSAYFPTCYKDEKILVYNIYSYTEAENIYVKEEIKTEKNTFEKITVNNESPKYFVNNIETSELQTIFEREDLDYTFINDELSINDSTNKLTYQTKGNLNCELPVLSQTTNEDTDVENPVSFAIEQNSTELPYTREIYLSGNDFKITSEVIRQENGSQIYFTKNISDSQVDATVTNLKSVFKVK